MQGNLFPLAYTSVSVILGSLFLSTTATAFIGFLQILCLYIFRVFKNPNGIQNFVSLAFFFFFIITLSIINSILSRKDQETIANQIKELEKNRKKFEELSIRDPLTGLFNRRYLQEMLERELARIGRLENILSMAIIDIDHFKQINDSFGHVCGDSVLTAISDIFTENFRISDILCRYGGDGWNCPARQQCRRCAAAYTNNYAQS